jgi:hypothetical protein
MAKTRLLAVRDKLIPKNLAIHEAAHAVALHLTQKQLGWSEQWFRIVVRTQDEIAAGPFIDWRGQKLDVSGIVEASERYVALGTKVADMVFVQNDALPELNRENLIAGWRSAMEADVITSLAGPVADARYRYRWTLLGFLVAISRGWVHPDFETARRKISAFTGTDQEADKMFLELLERSWRLIGRNWRRVIALAAVVRERRVVESDDAIPIIEGAS